MKFDIVAISKNQKLVLVLDPSIVIVSIYLIQAEKDKRENSNIVAVSIQVRRVYGKTDLKVHGLILDC